MLRVLHIAPGIDGGGVGGVIYNYLSHMDLSDVHVEVLVRDYGHRQFLHDRFDELNIKVHYVIQRKENITEHFRSVREIIRSGNFDVVHCHDQNWSYVYLKIAKELGVPVRIAHSHLTVQTSGKLKIAILNLLTPALKRTATGYFACGVAAGAYMWGDQIAHSDKLYVMNNAVDVELFRFDLGQRIRYRDELGLEKKTVVGHIGRFSEQKNHVFLIDIFEEYTKINSEAVLVLVGIGELENQILELVKSKNLEDKVMFLGKRPDAAKLYNAFDVFVLPSLYEGLPVVGIEAQANGLPCCFSNTISDEVVVLPSTRVMKLTDSATQWAALLEKQIESSNFHERRNAVSCLIDSGYSIDKEAEKGKRYYLDEVKKRKRK